MGVETKIGKLSICELLALGERVCSTDFAVRFYSNEQQSQFFGNREALVHAVRRAYATGSPSSKGQIEDFIKALPEEAKNEIQYITLSTLKDRGWTDSILKTLSVQPDKFATNPYYRNAPQVKLYSLVKIKEVEDTPQFKELLEKSQRRKESALKAVNTKTNNLFNYVNSLPLKVEYMPEPELMCAAITSYNNWQANRLSVVNGNSEPFVASEKSDKDFLARIRLNYIRHNLTNYDEILDEIKGKVGISEVYPELKKQTHARIKAAWVKQSMLN